jgi:hypothetical protein
MVKLTNATEVFVILLHVSSFANTPTPRPHTPLVNGLSSNSAMFSATSDDTHLSVGITRSRSAQAAGTPKAAHREVPHSALPHQTFRIPPIPHQARATAEATLDVAS